MSIKFNEIEHQKKNLRSINLIGEIEDKRSYLLITLENDITVQADNYSNIGPILEEALRMTYSEDNIIKLKTFLITDTFIVIEIQIED